MAGLLVFDGRAEKLVYCPGVRRELALYNIPPPRHGENGWMYALRMYRTRNICGNASGDRDACVYIASGWASCVGQAWRTLLESPGSVLFSGGGLRHPHSPEWSDGWGWEDGTAICDLFFLP
jgi:hypothetical protein